MKQLIEMAVAAGRKRKSLETGYVHHYHGSLNGNNEANKELEQHKTIPVIENLLYAYALLRTKTIENVNEAKGILDGLLHFQNSNSRDFAFGNFPIYLHEYPVCKDRFTGLHAGLVIAAILKQFHQILGQDLKIRLEKSLSLATEHILQTGKEKGMPYLLELKMAVLVSGAASILQSENLSKVSASLLEEKAIQSEEAHRKEEAWYSPESLGEIAVALLLVYPTLSGCPFKGFWEHLNATWHQETASYIGPSLKEWQCGEEPEVTIYDYLMGYLSGGFSARAKKDSQVLLKCALIQPSDDVPFEKEHPAAYKGEYKGAGWVIYHTGKFAYSFIDTGSFEVKAVHAKGFYPFKLHFGNQQRVHTFACQNGNAKKISFEASGGEITIDYQLKGLIEFEDRENSREIAFFVDAQDAFNFDVQGEKSSTFKLGELVTLHFSEFKIQIMFDIVDPDTKMRGRFLGHRMLGNRPAQIAAKGAMRYNAYDWQVFLRTVRRPEDCTIKVSLKILSNMYVI